MVSSWWDNVISWWDIVSWWHYIIRSWLRINKGCWVISRSYINQPPKGDLLTPWWDMTDTFLPLQFEPTTRIIVNYRKWGRGRHQHPNSLNQNATDNKKSHNLLNLKWGLCNWNLLEVGWVTLLLYCCCYIVMATQARYWSAVNLWRTLAIRSGKTGRDGRIDRAQTFHAKSREFEYQLRKNNNL